MIRKNAGLLITLSITITLVIVYMGDVVLHLNTTYFSFSDDGIKNYYTLEYHVAHDSSMLHFEGMNHPQGDHVMFTDGFFPVSFLLKAIKPVIDLSAYSHGILNSILVLSLIFAALVLYTLLREIKINEYVAGFFSPALIFFSPVIQRIPGHYSLSLAFFIPLLLLLLIRYYKNPKTKYMVWAAVTVFLCSLAHLYHIAMAGILISVFVFYMAVFDRKKTPLKKSIFFFLFTVIVPYAFIFIMMLLSDHVDDRSTYPFGFYIYRSGWEGVFLKGSTSGFQNIDTLFRVDFIEWEGQAFIGHLAAIFYLPLFGVFAAIPFLFHWHKGAFFIVLALSFIYWIFFRKKKNLFDLTGHKSVNAMLWAGMVALLISFALPVKLIPDLYYHLGPVREIRGIGRMNWIFFFAVNIGMIYFVQTKIKKVPIRYIISAIIIASVFYNAHKQCKVFLTPLGENQEISQTKQIVDHSPFADETFVQNHNAIITLPAVLVGSENLGYHEQGMHLMRFAFLSSLKSGLPLVSSIMSRTSIQQTIDKVSFLLGPYNRSNKYLESLPDGNYVVLVDKNRDITRYGEQLISSNADSVWSFSNYWVGTISKNRLNQIYAMQVPDSGDIHPNQALYWNDYGSENSEDFYFTSGASQEMFLENPVNAINVEISDSMLNRQVELSFWYSDIHQDALSRGSCEIAFFNENDSTIVYDLSNLGKNIVAIDSNWVLFKRVLFIPSEVSRMQISFIHYELEMNSLRIDNVLLRDVNTDVYFETPAYIMKNNYFYPKSE